MGDRVEVAHEYPAAGVRVAEESGSTGMITGHNALGNPVMLPDGAVIGHELHPGEIVTIVPAPDDLA